MTSAPDERVPADPAPDDPVPDGKDWTWVLARRCDECGFDAAHTPHDRVPGLVRGNVAAWAEVLSGPAEGLRWRPPGRWSALEYACHVRDVFRLYEYRLGLMLAEDDPLYPNWDQDATAVDDRYREQDPATVGVELVAAGESVAAAFDAVTGDQWLRPGRRSDGVHFTVDTFSRYFVHDPVHHLWDVTGRRAAPA